MYHLHAERMSKTTKCPFTTRTLPPSFSNHWPINNIYTNIRTVQMKNCDTNFIIHHSLCVPCVIQLTISDKSRECVYGIYWDLRPNSESEEDPLREEKTCRSSSLLVMVTHGIYDQMYDVDVHSTYIHGLNEQYVIHAHLVHTHTHIQKYT